MNELLRARSWGVVFSALFRGQKVIIKKIQKPGAATVVQNTKAALACFDRALGHDPYRASRCLATLPGQGLIITEFVDGRTLHEELQSASGKHRNRILTRLGGWLEQAATIRTEGPDSTVFSPDWTLSQLAGLPYDSYPAEERAILQSLFHALTRFGTLHRGTDMRLCGGHDDFHAQNFIWTDAALWAIDVEAYRQQPAAKMLGNFLGWEAMHSPCSRSPASSPPLFGTRACDIDALTAAVQLRPDEKNLTLPFFLIARQLESLFPASKKPLRRQENIARAKILLHDLCTLMDRE